MTCFWVINTPPHLFLVNRPNHVASLTSTCHGHSPNVDPVPPTIRPFFLTSGRTPQTAKAKTNTIVVREKPFYFGQDFSKKKMNFGRSEDGSKYATAQTENLRKYQTLVHGSYRKQCIHLFKLITPVGVRPAVKEF